MIGRLRDAWDRYWFAPAPLVNLAACRLVIAGYHVGWLLKSDHTEVLAEQAALPDFMYDPLPVLHALIWPFGWTYRPGREVLETIYWIAILAGALAVLGLLTRISLSVFAVASVFLQAHAYSFGDFHHPEGVVLIALVVLAVAPSGRVLSVDQLWRRWRGRGDDGDGFVDAVLSATSEHARWPLLLVAWTLSLVYLSAAVSKLAAGGLDWMNGHTLQYYLFQDALRWGKPLGLWLAEQHGLVVVISWLTVLFEGTFFLVLLFPALALVYVPVGTAMHAGIELTMRATFLGWIALYAAFVPWRRVGVWLRDRLSGGSRRPEAADDTEARADDAETPAVDAGAPVVGAARPE